MHKILIYTLDKKPKVRETLEYQDISEFIVQFSVFRKSHQIEFIIDEDLITFDELIAFLGVLFEKPFKNKDQCKTKEDLIEWVKDFQFMCTLDSEIS